MGFAPWARMDLLLRMSNVSTGLVSAGCLPHAVHVVVFVTLSPVSPVGPSKRLLKT